MNKFIKIRNLDCANCAAELQEELEGIKGVDAASVDFVGQRVSLSYSTQEAFEKAIYSISHFEEVEIIDDNAPVKKERHLKQIISIAISAAFFVPALVLEILKLNEWVCFAFFLASFVAAGWSVAVSAGKNVGRAFKGGFHPLTMFDENILMLIASIGAIAIGEYMEAAAVMLLYQIGELLQSIAVGSSRGAITRLVQLKSASAIRIRGDVEEAVATEELEVGDVILIRKGDKVPVDCKLESEETLLDTKSLTGEAYLKEVRSGGEMLAGCVNEGNAIKARVLRLASESAVAKILELVENSTAKKAKSEKFITKFARIYTPVVVLLAVILAVIPPLFQDYNFADWIVRALNFLVISCPCALIISVPLTYFSGVGALARIGVLTKGATYLDELSKVRVAAFDKTGTLTEGKFSLGKAYGEKRTVDMAARLEKSSSHPLAQAFQGVNVRPAEGVEELAGKGLRAVIDGKEVLVGSYRLMEEHGIVFEQPETEALVVYVAEDGKAVGCVEIEDKIRPEAKEALARLKREGVTTLAVLTGDTKERAAAALASLPVDEIHAGLLPAEKPQAAQKLKSAGKLMYLGDGINDTPVMAESDLAVSMGGLGSDAAIEASDMVLSSDNLSALPKAVRGAKKTRAIVMQNIVFSIAVKVALMALSVFGFIPLWAAVLGDVGVMLLAVLNSMRMRAKLK